MKATAPEKIYFSDQQQWANPFIGLMKKCADTDIEYTRTDAFIEKATSYIKQYWIWNTKMIEDFKNYMKGE